MLLGLLVLWDLIAVLCPFGPLRLLLESSRRTQQPIPALLYSVTMLWLSVITSTEEAPSRQSLDLSASSIQEPTTRSPVSSNEPSPQDLEKKSGLKLGLGDFVFYSVLTARAGTR
jgi:presenilin 1